MNFGVIFISYLEETKRVPHLLSTFMSFVKDDYLDGKNGKRTLCYTRSKCRRSDFSRNGETTAL